MIRAYIQKLSNGKYRVISENGRGIGTFNTRDQAIKRLKKTAEPKSESIDLSDVDDLSYSAVMRKLRASGNDELFTLFRLLFKSVFDTVFPTLKGKSEEKAIKATILLLSKRYEFDGVDKHDAQDSIDPAIPRFSKVTDEVFRGGAPATPDDLAFLKSQGVKKIVSLDLKTGKQIDAEAKKLGMQHVMMPLMAKKQESLRGLMKMDLVKLLTDGGPTFVHCLHGKDRTGLVVALFRVQSGMSPDKAIEEADKFDFCRGLPPSVRVMYEKMISAMADRDRNQALDVLWPDAVADYKFDASYELNDPSFGVRLYEAAENNPYGMGDPSYGSHWDYVNEQYPTRDSGQGTPDGSVGGRDKDGKPIVPKPVPGGIDGDKMPQSGIMQNEQVNGLGPIGWGGGFV